jgi:hypothetical protein
MADEASANDIPADGRRKGERRQAQQPLTHPDRRKGERRSGEDRRASPRQ